MFLFRHTINFECVHMHDYFILLFGLFVQPVKDVKDVVTNSIKEATGEALAPVADNTKEVSIKDTRNYQVKFTV